MNQVQYHLHSKIFIRGAVEKKLTKEELKKVTNWIAQLKKEDIQAFNFLFEKKIYDDSDFQKNENKFSSDNRIYLNSIRMKLRSSDMISEKNLFDYTENWEGQEAQGLHYISDLQEIKTTWHPIENVGGASSSY